MVPKHEKGSYRLIHNLSFPPENSVNSGIDRSDSQVVYDSIDTVISLVKHSGLNALMAKTDITNAFCVMPIHVDDCSLLVYLFIRNLMKHIYTYSTVQNTCNSYPGG